MNDINFNHISFDFAICACQNVPNERLNSMNENLVQAN